MARSFNELSPRAQVLVFALLSLLAAVAVRQALLGPTDVQIAQRQTRLETLEADVLKAQSVAARLPAAEREVRSLEAQLRETEAVLPEEKDPQDVLRNLHEMASESLLDIASFKPQAAVPRAQYTEWPIELGVEGGYHDLGRFFDRIASMPRLMSVSDLEIRTQSRPNGRGTVVATCVATTFVFDKTMPPPPGGRP